MSRTGALSQAQSPKSFRSSSSYSSSLPPRSARPKTFSRIPQPLITPPRPGARPEPEESKHLINKYRRLLPKLLKAQFVSQKCVRIGFERHQQVPLEILHFIGGVFFAPGARSSRLGPIEKGFGLVAQLAASFVPLGVGTVFWFRFFGDRRREQGIIDVHEKERSVPFNVQTAGRSHDAVRASNENPHCLFGLVVASQRFLEYVLHHH